MDEGGGVREVWWGRSSEGVGWGRRVEILSVKEEGRGGESELGPDLDLDPDLWKILLVRFRQNDADPLDPDPQHCIRLFTNFNFNYLIFLYWYSVGILQYFYFISFYLSDLYYLYIPHC